MRSPGYYAIIPAPVRYSPTVNASAKLLYGEITALCEKEGHCWASNGYFAALYQVSGSAISEWVASLRKAGFIRVEIDQSKGNERKIYLEDAIRQMAVTYPPNGGEGSPPKGDPLLLENNTKRRADATTSLVLDSSVPEKKKRRGTINGTKPSQEMIETFAISLGLPKSDGTAMYWHFIDKNWKGINNWEATIRKWKEFKYLPSQKNAKFSLREVQPSNAEPTGWMTWLEGKPEYRRHCSGLKYSACPEWIRREFGADRKAAKK